MTNLPTPHTPFQAIRAVIGGEETDAVDARSLHAWLGVGRDFSNWFKARADEALLEKGFDYDEFCSPNLASKTGDARGGSNRVDYVLTVDASMHVAMLERTEIGRMVRQDAIEWKKRAKAMMRAAPVAPPVQLTTKQILLLALEAEERAEKLAGENKQLVVVNHQQTKEIKSLEDTINLYLDSDGEMTTTQFMAMRAVVTGEDVLHADKFEKWFKADGPRKFFTIDYTEDGVEVFRAKKENRYSTYFAYRGPIKANPNIPGHKGSRGKGHVIFPKGAAFLMKMIVNDAGKKLPIYKAEYLKK